MNSARRSFLAGALALGGARGAAGSVLVKDVTAFGAVGDGKRLNTRELQTAIDACAAAGGGRVYFPPGRYVSGTLFLKSHVTLELEGGATLAGSPDLKDYPSTVPRLVNYANVYTERSLLYAERVENIGIQGHGTIDGQGAAFHGAHKLRPFLIRMIECRDVCVRDVQLRDAAMWVLHLLACEDATVDGVTIHSRVQRNNDGIDVDSCRSVRISNCDISTIDDNIVLKSCTERVCRDIAVTNCVLSSDCSALKLGTESNGGFENIVFSNCSIRDTHVSGLDLLMVDGGRMERVAVSNLAMENVDTPIFIRLGDRGRPVTAGGPRPGVGTMRDIRISQVEAVGAKADGCLVSGIPGRAIENLVLDGIRIRFAGGVEKAGQAVPEQPEVYPAPGFFGTMPAYGLYCRHVKNLDLRGVELSCEKTDARPALVCEDVEGLALTGCRMAPVGLRDVRNGLVQGCRMAVAVTGGRTEKISFLGNDFLRAVECAPEVPQGAIFEAANRG